MDATSREGSLSLDLSSQTFTTPRPTFSTPMTPPSSSPSSSSARLSTAAAPPSEATSTDDLGPSAPASSASMLSFSRRTTDAGSSVGGDDDGRSIAATSATGDDGAGSSSIAPSTRGGGGSSSSSVATREDDSSVASGGGFNGRPPVDLQLVEALTGKDRLYVLSVAQDMEALFGNPSRASLSYSPSTSFHRRIVYQCAAYLGLQTGTGEAKAIVVRLPVELYSLASAPYRVIDIAPAPQPSSAANQPPSGFKLMRRDPASSLPASRGVSPGGDEVSEASSRKKSYEQRQAEYDAARNKIFSAQPPPPSLSAAGSDAGANGSEPRSALSGARANGSLSARGASSERRTGRSRASSHASSTDSVPVVFVEPPPSSAASSSAASAGFIYSSSAQQQYVAPLRPLAPTFDPSLPPSASNPPANGSPVYPSIGQHAPAMVKSGSNGSGSQQGTSSSARPGYRPRNARPPASAGSQYGSGGGGNPRGGGFQGYANQPRLYEPTSSGRPARPPASTYSQASDWQVKPPPPHPMVQSHPTVMPQQQPYQQPQMVSPQAYMFVPFDQSGATGYVGQPSYVQTPYVQSPYGQPPPPPQQHSSPYSSHSYPVTPSQPYLAAAPGPTAYYAQPSPAPYGQYRADGASSAPPFPHGHHHGQAQPQPAVISYGPGGQPYQMYGVQPQPQPQVVVPQPHPFPSDPSQQPWATTGGGPSVYHRSDSSVSSFGEGSSRPQSRGSTSSRLSFGASSGMSNLRQPAWASDVATTASGSRQSWASTSNAGTTSGRSGRRRSSGAGTDRPSSPSSTTSSVSRTRGLSQLAHIPPPKDHPLPPRPDWSVGHQQFDLKRPDGTSMRTPPRLTSTNDFPPLANVPAPAVTSPKAGDGIWSGGRGRAAVLRATTTGASGTEGEPYGELVAPLDRTLHGQSMQAPQMPASLASCRSDLVSARTTDRLLTPSAAADDDDDDFEPRRPIARSSAALFDPSPAPSALPRNGESALKDDERASIEDRLASINLGLSAGEGQGAAVIGPPSGTNGAGLTYSSIVRRA